MKNTQTDNLTETVSDLLLDTINSQVDRAAYLVYDEDGCVPDEVNNYLLSEDGKTYSGLYMNEDEEEIPFRIVDNDGVWSLCL